MNTNAGSRAVSFVQTEIHSFIIQIFIYIIPFVQSLFALIRWWCFAIYISINLIYYVV